MGATIVVLTSRPCDARTQTLDERAVPLMGVMAAFIFAAQMFNFPVAGGTSGHLLGGVLAAVAARAVGGHAGDGLRSSAVQALLFQDGGLLALGANIFNMGVVGTLGGYGLYRGACRRPRRRGSSAAAGGAASPPGSRWSAGAARHRAPARRLGRVAARDRVPAMVGVHALIGIGEALITVAALAFIGVTRPSSSACDERSSPPP